MKIDSSSNSSLFKEKKNIILMGVSVIIAIFYLLIGFILWPLVGYITGFHVNIIPLVFVFVLLVLICIFQIGKKHLPLRSILIIPIFVCGILEFFLLSLRYDEILDLTSGYFHDDVIVVNGLSGKKGLANPLGINVLSPDYDYIIINDKLEGFAILYKGKERALYSLDKKEIVLPFGQSLLTYGEVFEINGLYGIATRFGDVIVEPKYEKIDPQYECFIVKYNSKYYILSSLGEESYDWSSEAYDSYVAKDEYIFVKKDGKWGVLNKSGYEWVHPNFDNYCSEIKSGKDGKYYAILVKDSNYYLFGYKNYGIYEYAKTKYKIDQVVNPERIIVMNSDNNLDERYGVIDNHENLIIDFYYRDIYYSDSDNRFVCKFIDYDERGYRRFMKKYYDIDGNIIKEE